MSAEYDEVLRGVDASRRAGWAHYYAAIDTVAEMSQVLIFISELAQAGKPHWNAAQARIAAELAVDVERATEQHRMALQKRYATDEWKGRERDRAAGWALHAYKPVSNKADALCRHCARTREQCGRLFLD